MKTLGFLQYGDPGPASVGGRNYINYVARYPVEERHEHSEPFPGGEYKDGEGYELSEIEDENKHSLAV